MSISIEAFALDYKPSVKVGELSDGFEIHEVDDSDFTFVKDNNKKKEEK